MTTEAQPSPTALRRCVGDPDAFLADHWTRRPLLHRQADPDGFGDLLCLDDVDRLLTSSGIRAPAVRLVRDGAPLPTSAYTRRARLGSRAVEDLVDPGRTLNALQEGATIVLQGLQRFWPPLSRLCRDLELILTHAVQANAYLTPPGAQGLRVHHDTHDVFALQTHGRKHWVVYEPHLQAPLPGQGWAADEAETDPILDVQLRPGDALYVPRGTPHAAATVEEPSLHITIGVVATTWHDVLRRLVEHAKEEPAFRTALPAGYADNPAAVVPAARQMLQEMAKWLGDQDPGPLIDETAERFWGSRRPLLAGQLGEVLALDQIDDDTVVMPRPGAVRYLREDLEALTLVLGDRRVELPVRARAAVERLLDADRLRVGDLRDVLDTAGRRVLVSRFVREGVLTVAPTGDHG